MNSIFQFASAHWVEITAALTLLVGAARIIVKLTPSPVDDGWLAKLITLLEHIGLKLPLIFLLLLPLGLASCSAFNGARFSAGVTGEKYGQAYHAEFSIPLGQRLSAKAVRDVLPSGK